ncbi:MAG: arylesterase [Myxococcota bacterium]|nr:arylesterase [Myxococcota bacterium]
MALVASACKPAETAPLEPGSPSGAAAPAAVRDASPVVLFLGTSLTAGYGLPAEEAFPALVQERIDAEALDYRVVNAGVSGDTSAGGLRRLDWLLRLPVAVLVLELGANDMLRGQSVEQLARNLEQIVERTRTAHPGVKLVVAGMRAAPNLGARYVREFEAVYRRLAQEYGGVLVPFLLEGVAGRPSLNLPDGIHPTAEGHQRIAQSLWPLLEPVLRSP